MTEQQITMWFKYFAPTVQKYDDIINNHIRFSSLSLVILQIRDLNAKKASSSGNRIAPGGASRRNNEAALARDESESEFISEDEDPQTLERNRIFSVSITNFAVAICLQQSQTAGTRKPGAKGSSQKGHGNGQRSFSGKQRARRRGPSQKGGRSNDSVGRAGSNGKKGAGLVRPMAGRNRF